LSAKAANYTSSRQPCPYSSDSTKQRFAVLQLLVEFVAGRKYCETLNNAPVEFGGRKVFGNEKNHQAWFHSLFITIFTVTGDVR